MSKHGPYKPPVITVERDESGYRLCATSYGRTEFAGARLFRGEPHPVVQFSHQTEDAALRDAAVLRAYLEACSSGKVKDVEQRKGWWET